MFEPSQVAARGLACVSMGRPDVFPKDHPVAAGRTIQNGKVVAAKYAVEAPR